MFFVLGVVGNGTAQMAYSGAVSSWFHARRGTALAVVMAGGAVEAMVLPPIAESLIARYGWRQRASFSARSSLSRTAGSGSSSGGGRNRRVSPRRPWMARHSARLRSRVFWILVAVLFGSSIAQNGAITHLAALLTDRGVTAHGAALSVSAMGAASLAGRLVTGWLLDRFFAARVAFGLLTMAALGTLLLATADSLALGVLAAALIGLGMGGEADVTPYLLSRYFGTRVLGPVRVDVDGLRNRRSHRANPHGARIRRRRLVRDAAACPGRGDADGGDDDAVPAAVSGLRHRHPRDATVRAADGSSDSSPVPSCARSRNA